MNRQGQVIHKQTQTNRKYQQERPARGIAKRCSRKMAKTEEIFHSNLYSSEQGKPFNFPNDQKF